MQWSVHIVIAIALKACDVSKCTSFVWAQSGTLVTAATYSAVVREKSLYYIRSHALTTSHTHVKEAG